MNLHTDKTLIRIVDPDGGYRQKTVSLLRREGWKVFDYPDGASFLKCDDLQRPGMIISAEYTPQLGGLELLSILKMREVDLPVVLISDSNDVAHAVCAMKSGAADYLLKTTALDCLVKTVSEVIDVYIEKLSQDVEIAKFKENLHTLTAREREVLELISDGLISKEISELLGITLKTVEHYRARIHAKFGIDMMSKIVYHFIRVRRDFE